MSDLNALLEVQQYDGEGYLPLIDYGEWRVAVLRYIDELLPENLHNMQRHDETDEVFVLLEGNCILFLGSGSDDGVEQIFAQDMQPLKLYNVKRRCWHNHTLSQDATVLIIENRDTTDKNSPQTLLNSTQRETIQTLTRSLWDGK